MNGLVKEVENRIRNFLSTESELHNIMDSMAFPEEELNRRCKENDLESKKIVNRYLFYVWSNLGEFSSPFLSLINDQEFLELKSSKIDYREILDSSLSTLNIPSPKFNIIVPVKNRKKNLDIFLLNASKVLKDKSDWTITVIFQEENTSLYEYYSTKKYEFNINWIHLPHSAEYDTNMNKSLCYNIASLLVPCKYQINHDVDLIFDDVFLIHIETKTADKNFKWIQPYRGSRVVQLNEEESNLIEQRLKRNEDNIYHDIQIPPLKKTPIVAGAPGGSIVVKYKDFIEIGGYDPELSWGYAPEDTLFWYKLESYCGCIQKQDIKFHPFCSDDVFSHETSVELYHVYHSPTASDKRYPFFSTYIVFWLMNMGNKSLLDKLIETSKQKMSITK